MLLLLDAQQGRALVHGLAAALPQRCIPVEVEEIGGAGMDIWLSSLAYGAAEVVLLAMPSTPRAVMKAVQEQLRIAHDLLQGMGYEAQALRLHRHSDYDLCLPPCSAAKSTRSLRPKTHPSWVYRVKGDHFPDELSAALLRKKAVEI